MKVRAAVINLTHRQVIEFTLRCPKLCEVVKAGERYAIVFFQTSIILFDRVDKPKKL